MRKVIVGLVFYWMLFGISAVADTYGQRSTDTTWNTQAECEEAFDNKTYSIYQSRFRNNATRVKGLPTFNLPGPACVEQDVVGGKLWTIQDTTIKFARKGETIYRADCGNVVYNIVQLEQEVAEQRVEQREREVVTREVPRESQININVNSSSQSDAQARAEVQAAQQQQREYCPEGTLREERTGQCIERKQKGMNPWVAGAIGAGAGAGITYAICRWTKGCGSKTKIVYRNKRKPGIIPIKGPGTDGNPPRVPPGTRGRTTGDDRAENTGTGTRPSRPRANAFTPPSSASSGCKNRWGAVIPCR